MTGTPQPPARDVPLTDEDLARIVEALDSHAYWQLSDPVYRNDGYVNGPGSDDAERAAEIEAVNSLHDRLESLTRPA